MKGGYDRRVVKRTGTSEVRRHRLADGVTAVITYATALYLSYIATFIYFVDTPFRPNGPYGQRTCMNPHLVFGQICRDWTERGTTPGTRWGFGIVFLIGFLVLGFAARRFVWILLLVPVLTIPYLDGERTVWLVSVLVSWLAVAAIAGVQLLANLRPAQGLQWLTMSLLAVGIAGATILSILTAGPLTATEDIAQGLTTWPSIELYGISCPSRGACVAVGDRPHGPISVETTQAFVVEQRGGTWAAPMAVGPPPNTSLEFVSCSAVGDCISNDGGNWLIAQSNGRWVGSRRVTVPHLDRYGQPFSGMATACSPGGACWLVGWALVSEGRFSSIRYFVVGEARAQWIGPRRLGSGNARILGLPVTTTFLSEISCWSTSSCTLVETSANRRGLATFMQTEVDNKWGLATTVPGSTGSANTDRFVPRSLSCTGDDSCLLGGYELNGTETQIGYARQRVAGRWERPVSGIGVMAPYTQSMVWRVSCRSASLCIATGDSYLPQGGGVPFAQVEVDGRWQRPLLFRNLGLSNGAGSITGAACPTATTCDLVGEYATSNSRGVSFAARYSGSTWHYWRIGLSGQDNLPSAANAMSCAGDACWVVGTVYRDGVPTAFVFRLNEPLGLYGTYRME